ncbi:MAG: hypothetical protein HYS17_02755 [Micavibrio aeruginosavorus]|uniref:DUF4760 domain-containing protein n=1 Tax=Micavibrio aeruginosavorus TaxID=349221 RepID=A0A7T5R384_9BACT|nr:MAG: hypothetical protein HYS17_02755 [Micavibrio aeruginosavorus]
MMEAIFGLVGVLIGSGITWFQTVWVGKQEMNRSARYLAIRIVCILDKYVEDCAAVVRDDGLNYGLRTPEGHLEPQVKSPGPPVYPDDVDWKSIDHEMMYKILSFPADVEGAEKIIRAARVVAKPPNFEDWFDERAFWYAQFGLAAYALAEDLSKKYSIQKKTYKDWNPVLELKTELEALQKRRAERFEVHKQFVNRVLGAA